MHVMFFIVTLNTQTREVQNITVNVNIILDVWSNNEDLQNQFDQENCSM